MGDYGWLCKTDGSGIVQLAAGGNDSAALDNGGTDEGAPGPRRRYGSLYYAGYVRDPDGVRVEFVSGSR